MHFLGMMFFAIGAFATFFDLLTYPLVTLGFPLVLAVILENRKGKSLLQQMIFIIEQYVRIKYTYNIMKTIQKQLVI